MKKFQQPRETLEQLENRVERDKLAFMMLCALASNINSFDYARNDANGQDAELLAKAAYRLTNAFLKVRNAKQGR